MLWQKRQHVKERQELVQVVSNCERKEGWIMFKRVRRFIRLYFVLSMLGLLFPLSGHAIAQDEEEKPWKGTVWLPLTSLTYEIGSTRKSTLEIGMPYFFALGGGSLLSLGLQMNNYSQPVTLSPIFKGTSYTFVNATVIRASGAGETATLWSLGAGIGYRHHFSKQFHARIGIGVNYFGGDVKDVGFTVFTIVPYLTIGFSF